MGILVVGLLLNIHRHQEWQKKSRLASVKRYKLCQLHPAAMILGDFLRPFLL